MASLHIAFTAGAQRRRIEPARGRWSRRIALIAMLFAGAALAGVRDARADAEHQRRSLAGLGGVHLEIALQGDDLARNDLSEANVRPDVESSLKAAGLRLLTADESAHEPGV